MLYRKIPGVLLRAVTLTVATLSAATTALAVNPMAAPLDMGATPDATVMTVSVVLKLQHAEELDEFIAQTVTPGHRNYHRFLNTQQFRERYAPSNGELQRVTRYLQSLGIVVNEVYANNLIIKATGTSAQFSQAFATSMRDYDDERGRRFRRPERQPRAPELLQDLVLYVAGLNTQTAQFKPHLSKVKPQSARLAQAAPAIVLPSGNSTATGVAGSFTTGDVANFYGVNPLYAKGITGKGMTVGIATLADFVPDDAFIYWNAIGLKVKPGRIKQVRVDGGGELSAAAGSGETTLDVQQSGGLAPDAKVVVYDAPNTEAGFIDVFYKAVADNEVDTLSVSWGSPEIFSFDIPGIFTDTRGVLVAYHQAFAEAAAQGISTFAASGDAGAYDTDRSAPFPFYSKILTVDTPSSDPYIIAAGGTTVPATLTFGSGTVINVPSEQVWGWDYLRPLCGPFDDSACGIFSVGGGGGVSVFWQQPFYQQGVPGIRKSEPNQVWTYTPDPVNAPGTQFYLYTVPANVKGRNVPDISLNSDPETGYLLYSSLDGGWSGFYGGTSFASPQLNGIFSLVAQATGSRLGLLHPQLYALKAGKGLVDIAAGDNWFYQGAKGYEPGAGLGVIDAAKLSRNIP